MGPGTGSKPEKPSAPIDRSRDVEAMTKARFATALLSVALTSPCQTVDSRKQPKQPPTYFLEHLTATSIAAPAFSFTSSQCSDGGSALLDTSTFSSAKVLLKLDADGKFPVPIPLPTVSEKGGDWQYSIDNQGNVSFLLAQVKRPVLIRESSDGQEINRTELALPSLAYVHSFAAQPDGAVLVLASLVTDAKPPVSPGENPKLTDTRYLFWFDSAGRILKKDQFGKSFSRETTPEDGLVVSDMAGIFYSATSTEVRLYGRSGELMRSFSIMSPVRGATLSGMRVNDGRMALKFSYPTGWDKTGPVKETELQSAYIGSISEEWALVNTLTEEITGFYRTKNDFSGTALCYLGNTSFLYYSIRDGQPQLVHATP